LAWFEENHSDKNILSDNIKKAMCTIMRPSSLK